MIDNNVDVKGYLKKLKSSTFAKIFGNTNMRWFELLFNNKEFLYRDKKDSKAKETFQFSDITDFVEKVRAEEAKQCDWMFGFIVKIKDKQYFLFTETQTEYKRWINA